MLSFLQSVPALWRKRIYFAHFAVVVALGAMQVGIATAGDPEPDWMKVALAVVAYVSAALGLSAGVNVNQDDGPPPAPADGGLDLSKQQDDPTMVAGKGAYRGKHARQ